MNEIAYSLSIKRWRGMKLSYLTSEVPPDKYDLFLRGNLLVFSGYVIATLETLIAIYAGLTIITYEQTFYISIPILLLSCIITSITYFNKNLLVWHELLLFGIYVITYLVAFCVWIYWLGDLRFLGILNAITAVTVALSYTNALQSLFMSMPTLICYSAVTFYSIVIAGQPGSLMRETFLSLCLFPAFLFIASTAYYINRKREDIEQANNELEKLNYDLTYVNDRLKKEQHLSEIEMDLASEIQNAIFPKKAVNTTDWDIAFLTKPYGAVSGDFYDFYCRGNSLKGVSLFDVSGHGVAPALITILAKPVLYSYFNKFESSRLGLVFESANSELLDELETVNLYITGLLLRMNGLEVEYVNAGHPDLFHLKASGGNLNVMNDAADSFKGHPLGISRVRQEYQSIKFNVAPGDFLIFYSDGLTECRNEMGEQFGVKRLSDVILSFKKGNSAGLLAHIMKSFYDFTANAKAGDDITIIIAGKL